MADYIERSTAIEAFENGEADVIEDWGDGCEFGFGLKNIRDTLNALPAADVVRVVRCRECKYSYRIDGAKEEYDCRKMSYFASPLPPNHFCSYGERRGENEV